MSDTSTKGQAMTTKHPFPDRLTLRDTKVNADEGQRIYSTATGYGYEWCEYVRADRASPPSPAPAESGAVAFDIERFLQDDSKLPAPSPAPSEGDGLRAWRDVLAERKRQVESEGWTPEHDDAHAKGEMASAAGVYALAAGSYDYRWVLIGRTPNDYLAAALKLWPWEPNWFKPKDRRRDLVKAGALILAELERLDRASLKENHP